MRVSAAAIAALVLLSCSTIENRSGTGAAPAAAAVDPADPVSAGLALFNDRSLSGSGTIACSTCHPRGGHTDNKTYVGLEVVPDGTPEGRSTPLLWGARDTGPYSWAGGRTIEENIRGIIVNRMKGAEPAPDRLAQLAAYVLSLQFPRNDSLDADGTPSATAPAAAKRGHEVFLKASCNICHEPPIFSKADNEDIGSGGSFSVPSLRGVSGTAPYFHDGRYPTLRVLVPAKLALLKELGVTDALTDQEIEDLIAFLEIL